MTSVTFWSICDFMQRMKLFNGIYATRYKALVIGRTAIVADLHIGLEKELVEEGVFFPSTQFNEMKQNLEELIGDFAIEKLIFAGDFKQNFSDASRQEWNETKKLIAFLSEKLVKIVFVRGNHDNYLKTIISRDNVAFNDDYFALGDIAVAHGHRDIVPLYAFRTIVVGHEHPAIFLKDDLGLGVKLPCFLYKKGKPNIIVLPAFSPLVEGVDVLSISSKDFLSPVLRRFDIGDFIPVAVEENFYKFPEIRRIPRV